MNESRPANCWEYMNCGMRRKCPAYPDYGQGCFVVTGTMACGRPHPTFASKMASCRTCPFYAYIMSQAVDVSAVSKEYPESD